MPIEPGAALPSVDPMVEVTVIRTVRTVALAGGTASRTILAYLTALSSDSTSGIISAAVDNTVAAKIMMTVTASAVGEGSAESLALVAMQDAVNSADLAIIVT